MKDEYAIVHQQEGSKFKVSYDGVDQVIIETQIAYEGITTRHYMTKRDARRFLKSIISKLED